ncbi:MAG TPA: hypothetical protein [Caudoviricetes sp.]|nr:MAG TPA: hypothetical protein [Caudoviricetes sp.]
METLFLVEVILSITIQPQVLVTLLLRKVEAAEKAVEVLLLSILRLRLKNTSQWLKMIVILLLRLVLKKFSALLID